MINAIINNPYRVLGVYSNAAKKDIVANKGRAIAFLKDNRPAEFPLDLKGILPPLTRTLDSMNEAEAHLAIAKDQIKYAQLWFIKILPIDDIAFNHLLAGNMAGAIEIWSKQDSLSSLQNRIVCYLIENNYSIAIETAEKLYGKFGDGYIRKIDANSTLQMTSIELFHQFVDSLGEEAGLQQLIDNLPPDIILKEYNHLKQIVSTFLLLPSNMDAILKLLSDTCDDLISIKEKLGKDHAFYRQQCTFIARMALNKSIDILNRVQEIEFDKLRGIERDNAFFAIKHIYSASWEAILWIELLDTDDSFKTERLNPNKITLTKILDQVDAFKEPSVFKNLPGRSYSVFEGCARNVKVDPYLYYTESELFSACITLSICDKYLEKYPKGEHVAEVHSIIQQIKDDQHYNLAKTINDYKYYIQVYPNGRHVDEAKQRIQDILDEQRKKREKEINDILAGINNCQDLHSCISLLDSCRKNGDSSLVAKLDDKFYSLCRDVDNFKLYIETFGGDARHIDEARELIRKIRRKNFLLVLVIVITIISAIGLSLLYKFKEKERAFQERQELMYRQYENLLLTTNTDSCIIFLQNFPDCNDSIKTSVQTVFSQSLMLKSDSLIKNYNDDINVLQIFINKYRYVEGFDSDEAVDKVEKEIEKAKERQRKREEYNKYGTESNAWRTATSINTIDAYRDYLERYPKGAHKNAANKLIVDFEVQEVIDGDDYDKLPSSQQVLYRTGDINTVKIRSRCNKTITIMYSGKKSIKIEIDPYGTSEIVLPSGLDNVVAKAPGVRSFYGMESLTGGIYESEYYIEKRKH